MPIQNKLSSEVLTLIRGAIDSKIEVWKNISAAEKASGIGIIDEDFIDDIACGVECSHELTDDQLNQIMQEYQEAM